MDAPATVLTVALFLQLAIAPTYARLQRRFADPRRRPVRASSASATPWRPGVDIIVPCYNEEPLLLASCLASLRGQDYQGPFHVWVVDDGSDNRADLLPVLKAVEGSSCSVVLRDRHEGKREAQAAALFRGRGEILLTVDSDTTIVPDGISKIIAPLLDPTLGAVTGSLRVSNLDTWLTRLIQTRYGLLFDKERGAQSHFRAVLCCAGPFSAYRRSAVESVWSKYVGQRAKKRRVFGDDLELTNLVLDAGWGSVYEPMAKASTNVPSNLTHYIQQQIRWNRSFYRELPRMLSLLPGRSRYLAVDLAARTLMPVLVAVGLASTVIDVMQAPERLPWDAGALALMGLASLGLVPSPSTADGRRFILLYGLVFIVVLLPTRLWAACTCMLFKHQWRTRDRRRRRSRTGTSKQSLRPALPDLASLLLVEDDRPVQLPAGFAAAATQQEDLG